MRSTLLNACGEQTSAVLRSAKVGILAHWYCELNCWRWPKAIPDPVAADDHDNPRRIIVMRAIQHIVGEYRTSKQWNVIHQKTMNAAEFELWWNNMTD